MRMRIGQKPLLIPLFLLIECLITVTVLLQYLGGLLAHIFQASLKKGTRIETFWISKESGWCSFFWISCIPFLMFKCREGVDQSWMKWNLFELSSLSQSTIRISAKLVLLQTVISCLCYVDPLSFETKRKEDIPHIARFKLICYCINELFQFRWVDGNKSGTSLFKYCWTILNIWI